jgi:hypothetical protein
MRPDRSQGVGQGDVGENPTLSHESNSLRLSCHSCPGSQAIQFDSNNLLECYYLIFIINLHTITNVTHIRRPWPILTYYPRMLRVIKSRLLRREIAHTGNKKLI